MVKLNKTDSSLFFSKNDSSDLRMGDCASALAQPISLSEAETKINDLIIWGYPDDQGIKNNGGRIGAALAPKQIRSYFYRLTTQNKISIADLGDLETSDSIETNHIEAFACAQSAYKHFPQSLKVSLGGGHDYGFADAEAFLLTHPDGLVLNFDAHLDVRDLSRGLTSGTPFFRLLQKYPQCDFTEIGIQSQCNAKSHFDYLANLKKEILLLGQLTQDTEMSAWGQFLERKKRNGQVKPVFISLDIDVFCNSEAPGCSQSWPGGLRFQQFKKMLSLIPNDFVIQHLGIYEVSPTLDVDNRTSKLAALCIYEILQMRKGLKND